MRSVYKDFVWLLEHGTLVPQQSLQTKNELTHANDYKTSNSPLTGGRDYEETREYYHNGTVVKFTFLTKLFSPSLTRAFALDCPDVVVINSCVWDLSRWGPNGVAEYKRNMTDTMELLKKTLTKTCKVIFTTTLPLSTESKGGFLKQQIEFLRSALPLHLIEANTFLAEIAQVYGYDVLDFYYSMRFLQNEWMPDGIHWTPVAYRLLTNLLLTHLALSANCALPGVFALDDEFIQNSQFDYKQHETNDGCANNVFNNSKNERGRCGLKRKAKIGDEEVAVKKLRLSDEAPQIHDEKRSVLQGNLHANCEEKFTFPVTNNDERVVYSSEKQLLVASYTNNMEAVVDSNKKQLPVTNSNESVVGSSEKQWPIAGSSESVAIDNNRKQLPVISNASNSESVIDSYEKQLSVTSNVSNCESGINSNGKKLSFIKHTNHKKSVIHCNGKQLPVTSNTSHNKSVIDSNRKELPVTSNTSNSKSLIDSNGKQLPVTSYVNNNKPVINSNRKQLPVTYNASNSVSVIDSYAKQLFLAHNANNSDLVIDINAKQLPAANKNRMAPQKTINVNEKQLLVVCADNKQLSTFVSVDNNELEYPEMNSVIASNDHVDFSKDQFTFTNFIEKFSPQLSSLQ